MSQEKPIEFIDISIQLLKRFDQELPFDIYVKRTEGAFTKVFPAKEIIDWERVANYTSKGLELFFVKEEDYLKYTAYLEKLSAKVAGQFIPGSQIQEASNIVKELLKFSMYEIQKNSKVNISDINNAADAVSGCINILESDPKALLKIIRLMANQDYLLKHSITTSVFSILLAKADGIETKANLHFIGLGGFLHDIGMSHLQLNPETSDQELTSEQWKEVKTHPELGKRMVDRVKVLRSEVANIILQHHEQPNGGGYPNHLKDPEIYYPAKIIAIADSFSALISKSNKHGKITPKESIEIMYADLGKFDKKLLRTFDKFLFQN